MDVSTAVVLAAGEGTRLRPMTHNRPKTMLPAADRPILEHVLDPLVAAGMDEICLVVGYRRERVQEHFGHAYRDVPLTYVHQAKQLGSGHALLQARNHVEGPLLVVNGDRVFDQRIVDDVLEGFDGTPTIAVLAHPAASQYGAVRVREGKLAELVEKPDSDEYRLINAGVYAFTEAVFEAIERTSRREGELQLPDTITTLMGEGPVRAVRTDGLWVDATYPWDLLFLSRELLTRGRVEQPQRADGVWIADGARVHSEAHLQPPVVVSVDAEIAAGAVVGPNVAIGRNVTVEANATLTNAVVDADTRIGPATTGVDLVAGQHVTVGAGGLVPGGPADVRVGNEIFEDQRLGAVLADRVTVGGGATFAPGTLVGAGADIGTGVHTAGEIVSGAEVVR